jgi:DNA-binding transcriptional ArsR family regulator
MFELGPCGSALASYTPSVSVKFHGPSLKIVRANLEDCYVQNNYAKLAAVFSGGDDTSQARLLNLTVDRLALLADPLRIRILAFLEQREASVSELTDELGTSPQNISRHLNILYRSGVVTRHRDGLRVYYALMDYSACLIVGQAIASIFGHIHEMEELGRGALKEPHPSG